MLGRAPTSTLLPYTTLFRSGDDDRLAGGEQGCSQESPTGRCRKRGPPPLAHACTPCEMLSGGRGPTRAPAASRWGLLATRSEEHTSELQSQSNLVCRLLLEK